ncbi:TraB/GumN family protein [Dongia rigui]|uniref:TraB/GumN family protein n=1 Tax=Dongia rigui TaxID=940149 RepID=A0ABU5DXM0_9PROT|nr:TraB/GumN family protein [Dongia rigui]MDY0872066.1 TraB/GumN family protein [Dongia rigui]
MDSLGGYIVQALRRAALGLLAFLPFIGTAAAEPALWVAKSGNATIYLFGTVHLLKPDADWRAAKIKTAFDSSSTLWLELDDAAKGGLDEKLLWKYGKDPAHPLSTKLTPAERQKLRAAAAKAGIPPVAFESLRPWLAALQLGKAPMMAAGYNPEMGVDRQLLADAKVADKPVMGLETTEQQMRFFADLPPQVELTLLTQTLDHGAEGAAQLDQLAGAWLAGDVDALNTLLKQEDMAVSDRRLRKLLLGDRNKAWAERLGSLAKDGGTHFVAVGAAHLTGADSLQNFLQQRGFKVTRL